MRILLFRHAQTPWTLTGQHTGKTDVSLTDAGRAEARAAAAIFRRVLDGRGLDAIYSSPRTRALETVELALRSQPTPIVTDLLAEFDYGAYEGLTPSQIQALAPGWSIWTDGCPNGETMADAARRADQFIELVRARDANQTICVASHGHMIRIVAARLLNLEGAQGGLFGIATASVAELVEKDGAFAVARWNLTSE